MAIDFNDLLVALQANLWPAMAEELSKQLGPVTPEAIRQLGVGYYPKEEAWVFPERDETGQVVGLIRRYQNGKKATWKGGKRGLSYAGFSIRQGDETISPAQFVRVGEALVPCPICGRDNDGCLVSDEDPADPRAAICVRTPTGAVRHLLHTGYLHHRKPHADYRGGAVAVLPVSDQPVVITEGATDLLAAMSLGYVAVSVPQAGAALPSLRGLVRGRDVVIVGDRDGHGVGQAGMEAVFEMLKPVCKSVVKVLPPEPFKDLRAWAPTAEQFATHIEQIGDSSRADNVLDSDAPGDIVAEWIKQTHMQGRHRLIHNVQDGLFAWATNKYREVKQAELRGLWYEWLDGRQISQPTKDGVKLVNVKPNLHMMRDLEDAARATCYIRVEEGAHEPLLLKTGTSMDLDRAVVFRNGIYYVRDARLVPITPDIFLTTTLPYDYTSHAECTLWEWFVADVFNGAQDCIDLLQEWMGYCLIASNHMQSMMFFFGVPGSGKSTIGRVVEAMLGQARCTAANTNSFKDLFGTATLLNKYVAIMSESRDVRAGEIDKLLQTWKAITGGDTLSIRKLYKDAVSARLFCRLMYIANDLLPFDDTSQAMASRANLLYFPNDYRKSSTCDRQMADRLVSEAPGIALWAIRGLERLLKTDRFTMPEASKEHLLSMGELTNPVGLMLDECCVRHVGADYFVKKTERNRLYDLWAAWCKATNTRNNLSRIGFGMKLRNMANPLVSKRVMDNGERYYAYEGISIAPAAMKNYLGG